MAHAGILSRATGAQARDADGRGQAAAKAADALGPLSFA
jgi:hypothetical protein